MTDFANLAIKIDSTQADDATRDLDRLTNAGKRTEAEIDRLGDTAQQSGQQMRGAGRAAADYAAAAQQAARGTTQVGEAGKLTAFQARNMAFQFQDLGVQFAMAAQSANPLKGALMALAMQGPQITSIMNEAGMSAGQLAKNMGAGALNFAKAHPILVGLTAAAGAAAGAFKLFTIEVEKTAELDKFVKGLGLTKDEIEKLGPVGITAGDAFKGLWKTIKEGLGLDVEFAEIRDFAIDAFKKMLKGGQVGAAGIYAAFVGTYRGIAAIWPKLPSIMGEAAIGAANLAIAAVEGLINRSIKAIQAIITATNPILLAAKMAGINIGSPTVSLGRLANPYSGAGANAAGAFAAGFRGAFNEAMGGMDGFINRWMENTIGVAKDRLEDKAEDLIGDRPARKGGAKAGKAAGEAAAEAFQRELAKLGEMGMEGILLGNIAREKNRAAELQSDLFDLNEDLKRNQEERTRGVLEEAEARRKLNDQLRETIMSLDQLGGMGRTLGDIGAFVYGARTGDFSGARGPAGFLAQTFLTTFDADGKRVLNGLGQDFSKALDKIFGTTGTFTKLLQGAGVGSAIGGMVFGQNSGANLGATLGGAFGESAFKSLAPKLFSSLGNFAGPLGTIAGSLLGGIFGSLFGKRPRGSGSVSNTGYGSSANDAGVGQSLDSFGMGLQSSIANIAQQLGGTVGAYSIGIGQYKDYYQVSGAANDPRLGGTYFGKKSSSALYDGKDAAAAMRAAIAGAIAQGALQGISAGAQTLLKSGKDIEAQLAKALKFQGVFDELKQSTDPLGAALDEITKRFDELRTIFAEAGASAEEYAQLEQLLALKRQEAQDDARRAVVDKVRDPIEMQIRLLELLGREEDALAASRLLELAGIKAALQPLQTMIYQLEDARKIIDTFEPLANDLKAFRDELLGGRGSDSFGYIAAQFRAIADAAAGGDATAMGKLRGAGTAYLDAARLNAGSDLEYRRALATVLTGVNGGIFAAETQVDYAQAQIDAINNSADILARMREEMSVLQTQIVENTGFVARLWSRFEGEGMPIRTLDEPLEIVAVGL